MTFDSGVLKAQTTVLKSFKSREMTPQSIILIGSEESVQGRKDYLRSAWLGRLFFCLTASSLLSLFAHASKGREELQTAKDGSRWKSDQHRWSQRDNVLRVQE